MIMIRRILGFFVLASFASRAHSEPESCEPRSMPEIKYNGGRIGQLREFPWLGVIKVHLYEGSSYKMAATGAVMIKELHVIALADDIIRIPRRTFLQRSKAMFVLEDHKETYFSLKEFIAHPEHEYETLNTIALIELVNDDIHTVLPICWPKLMYNTSNELYTIGYTDENLILEKVIHKIQYLNSSMCEEFYHRSEIHAYKSPPTHYHCGFAPNNNGMCQWDNGMVLASNSTGTWMIIGISVKGPGCAAPSRFIDMFHYFGWIDSMTETENTNNYGY